MLYRIETVTVQDSPMEVFMFEPEGEGTHPGLVLAQHIPVGHTGVENDTFTLKTAERFAENGFAVAVPFRRPSAFADRRRGWVSKGARQGFCQGRRCPVWMAPARTN